MLELPEIIGFVAALLVGLVLGLLGSGASILALPVMVYLFKIPTDLATAYSLFIIGTAALIGTLQNVRNRLVQPRTALLFSIPAVIAIAFARKIIIPVLPDEFTLGSLVLKQDMYTMILFALLMVLAAVPMIRGRREHAAVRRPRPGILAFFGLVVGLLSGMVGAGGGFLIIPALSIFMKIPIKSAIATSIMIIAINSLAGFSVEVFNPDINWSFLLLFTGLSVAGVFIGMAFNKQVKAEQLKSGFGYFVLLMGVFIILHELI